MARHLPIRVTHRSSPDHRCMAISSDGNTIALAVKNEIVIFPTYSPSLPSYKLVFDTELHKLNVQLQRGACADRQQCALISEFGPQKERAIQKVREVVHMAFHGEEDVYLIALGKSSIAIYDLMEEEANPIITAGLRRELDESAKVCFYPMNLERRTVKINLFPEKGLSCFEFMISDVKMEINYYRLVFCETDKWWYHDCGAAVNVLSNIEHRSAQTLVEPIPVKPEIKQVRMDTDEEEEEEEDEEDYEGEENEEEEDGADEREEEDEEERVHQGHGDEEEEEGDEDDEDDHDDEDRQGEESEEKEEYIKELTQTTRAKRFTRSPPVVLGRENISLQNSSDGYSDGFFAEQSDAVYADNYKPLMRSADDKEHFGASDDNADDCYVQGNPNNVRRNRFDSPHGRENPKSADQHGNYGEAFENGPSSIYNQMSLTYSGSSDMDIQIDELETRGSADQHKQDYDDEDDDEYDMDICDDTDQNFYNVQQHARSSDGAADTDENTVDEGSLSGDAYHGENESDTNMADINDAGDHSSEEDVSDDMSTATPSRRIRNLADVSQGWTAVGQPDGTLESRVSLGETQTSAGNETGLGKGKVMTKHVTPAQHPAEETPFADPEVEAELRVEQSQTPVPHADPGKTIVVFSVLPVSMTNANVNRKVASEYPVMEDEQLLNEALGETNSALEGRCITVNYGRVFLMIAAHEFGYVGIFRITVDYKTSTLMPEGRILQVVSGQPSATPICRIQLISPIAVENIAYSQGILGVFAVLGGDASLVMRCGLPEVTYNFDHAEVHNGEVTITASMDDAVTDLQTVFRHHETAMNALRYKVGAFGYCRGDCFFVTNSSSGLKIFGMEADARGRFLKVAIRCSKHFGFNDLVWIPHSMRVALLGRDGRMAILSPEQSTEWAKLVPNFKRIEKNAEYVEKESEFDTTLPTDEDEINRVIDYDKAHHRDRYPFFYKASYAVFGYRGPPTAGQPDFVGKPILHNKRIIDQYIERLWL